VIGGIPVARLFGIEIRLHFSWVFIIAIVTATVGTTLAPPPASESDKTLAWAIGGIASLVFMFTVVAHELAHALTERQFGMTVTSISVHFIGSPAVIDQRADTPKAEAAVALAGPLTSLAIGASFVLLALLTSLSHARPVGVLGDVLVIAGTLDLVLAGVSLVPAYPLDGGRVVRAIGWARTGDPRRGATYAAMSGRGISWLLVAIGLAAVLLDNIADGIMLGLIGWFLSSSARSVDRWVVLDGLIVGVRVEEAMEAEFDTITPGLTLDTFGTQVLDGTLGPALPVLRGEELVGIIGAGQLRGVPRRDWAQTRTSEVMVDLANVPTIGPDEPVNDALDRLRTSRLDGLPVLQGGDLRGVVTGRSIAVALRTRADLRGLTL
jgi:Zn-dependent protease/CBS domain-containing protein